MCSQFVGIISISSFKLSPLSGVTNEDNLLILVRFSVRKEKDEEGSVEGYKFER